MKNKHLKINLPIKSNYKLDLLIAKTMGDGGISSDFIFHYTNNNYDLIKEVVSFTNQTIGKTNHYIQFRKDKNNCYEIKFPSIVGCILMLFGATKGKKMFHRFDIPKWIKNGNKNIKAYFIRGIFDDESTINQSGRSRRIVFAIGKISMYETSLRKFLVSIKKLLLDFNIFSSKIHIQERYSNKIILRFTIYRKANFKNFYNQIILTHKEKRKKLNNLINSYISI